MNAQDLISFENGIAEMFEVGQLPFPIHYSGRGNEDFLIDFFKNNIKENDWVFSTWRSHYHALLKGIPPEVLRDKIIAGDSMHIMSKELRFFSSSIVAGCCPIAVGVAESIQLRYGQEKVWCFIGDGAEDQGVFYESVRYAKAFNLPVTFIIEDNGLSVDTTQAERINNYCVSWPNDKVMRYFYDRYWPHVQTGKVIKEYM